jgi:arylsulfatase A-like enzyme
VRVPCIARLPGKIASGRLCENLAATIDVLPTVAGLVSAELPEHKIDGRDIWPLLAGEREATGRETFFYYWGNELQAVRSGDWKLHFPHEYRSLTGEPGRDGKPAGYTNQRCGLELYNLASDIGEAKNVADENPAVVARLEALAETARSELGDSLTGRQGGGLRSPGSLDAAQ